MKTRAWSSASEGHGTAERMELPGRQSPRDGQWQSIVCKARDISPDPNTGWGGRLRKSSGWWRTSAPDLSWTLPKVGQAQRHLAINRERLDRVETIAAPASGWHTGATHTYTGACARVKAARRPKIKCLLHIRHDTLHLSVSQTGIQSNAFLVVLVTINPWSITCWYCCWVLMFSNVKMCHIGPSALCKRFLTHFSLWILGSQKKITACQLTDNRLKRSLSFRWGNEARPGDRRTKLQLRVIIA